VKGNVIVGSGAVAAEERRADGSVLGRRLAAALEVEERGAGRFAAFRQLVRILAEKEKARR
jgi:hypothetical protein